METCKHCRYWKPFSTPYIGECDRVDDVTDDETMFRLEVTVADDHNLDVQLLTGPDFGCVHFDKGA